MSSASTLNLSHLINCTKKPQNINFEGKEAMKSKSFKKIRKLAEIFHQKEPEVKSESTISNIREEYSKNYINESDIKIGFYTQKERIIKIRKYREKKQKFLNGELKNKDRYILRSKIAKKKYRIGGRFAKKVTNS